MHQPRTDTLHSAPKRRIASAEPDRQADEAVNAPLTVIVSVGPIRVAIVVPVVSVWDVPVAIQIPMPVPASVPASIPIPVSVALPIAVPVPVSIPVRVPESLPAWLSVALVSPLAP